MAANLADIALGSFAGVRGLRQQRFDNSAKTRSLGQVDREQTQKDRTQDQKDRELGQADTQLTINERIVKVSESAETRAVNVANIEALTTGNDQYIDSLNSAGLLSPDMLSLDQDKIRAGIQSGDATVSSVALDIITNSGELPEGSVASKIQPLEGGGYAVTVTNADGSIGALTEDGSSNPDSKVINFEVGKLANLGNLYYQKNVVNDSTLLSPTRIRAELNRVGTDAERNEILKKYERIQQQSDVLDSVPKEGGASRQIAGVIASATDGSETDDILSTIADDVNPDANKVKQRGKVDEQPEDGPVKVTGVSEDNAVASEYHRLIEGPQTNTETGRSAAMSHTARQAGPVPLTPEEYVQKQRDSLKSLESVSSSRSPALLKRINDKKEFLKAFDALNEQTFQVDITDSPVAVKVEGKTDAEVDVEINSGKIRATAEEAQIVAQFMKDKGITKMAEILRLNDKERAVARAVIISMEPDAARRRAISDEINNIYESSRGTASVSLKDEMDLDLENRKLKYSNRSLTQTRASLTQSTKEWSLRRYDSALTEAADWTKIVNGVWYGEDGDETNLDRDTATIVFRKHAPAMLLKAQNSATPEEAAIRFKALSATVSTGVAALAAEEESDIFSLENWNSFWRPNAEDNVEATDFDISRVAPVKNGIGKITGYYYMTPDGDKVNDEIVSVEALQSLSPEIENMVRDAAIGNSKKG